MESRWIRRFVATATIYSPGRVWSKTCLYSFCTNHVFLMTRLWIITPFVYLLISLMGRTTLTHVLQPLYSYNAVLTPLNASTANCYRPTDRRPDTPSERVTAHDQKQGRTRGISYAALVSVRQKKGGYRPTDRLTDQPTDRYYCKFPSTMYLCHGYPKRRQL